MLNIVIPMAGRGSRFAKAGYKMPKPLIDIHGHHMIEYVVKNLTPKCEHKFIFIFPHFPQHAPPPAHPSEFPAEGTSASSPIRLQISSRPCFVIAE